MLGSPWQSDGFHAVLFAFDPGRLTVEVGGELHRVKMPPTAFGGLVVELAGFAAFGARAAARFVAYVDVHSKGFDIEVNACDFPWRLKAEQ